MADGNFNFTSEVDRVSDLRARCRKGDGEACIELDTPENKLIIEQIEKQELDDFNALQKAAEKDIY